MHIINISAVIYSAKKSDSLPFQQIRVQLRGKGAKKGCTDAGLQFQPLSCQCLNTVWKQGFKKRFYVTQQCKRSTVVSLTSLVCFAQLAEEKKSMILLYWIPVADKIHIKYLIILCWSFPSVQ